MVLYFNQTASSFPSVPQLISVNLCYWPLRGVFSVPQSGSLSLSLETRSALHTVAPHTVHSQYGVNYEQNML